MTLLEVQNISKHFPGVQALTEVSMDVTAGEVHALVGQNGAGKSTLVKIISGAQAPDGGTIVFDGQVIERYSPIHAADLGIGVVYQRMQLIPWLSVAENILMGHLPNRYGMISQGEANRIAQELMQRMNVRISPATPLSRLSPAERQEVAIAKALFRRAKLLILDEPTAALDAEQIERLFALIADLKAHGVAVLYISHHLEEIFRLADRITILRDSRVVTTRPAGELNQTEVVTLMAGRRLAAQEDVEEALPPAVADQRPTMLKFEHLSGGALQDIDFAVRAGEVVGITGVIGAGGHDLARLLFGLDSVDSGRIVMNDRPYVPRGPKEAIKDHLFLVPEDPSREGLIPILPVAHNISLIDLAAISRLGFLSLRKERKIAQDYVKELSIATSSVDRPVRNLSGGNQQKVLLAKALQANAQVLVLEEPTQGVDVHAKAEIHKIVRNLAADGKAVLVISTDIRDLLLFVDRMVVLRGGRIVDDVRADETSYAQTLDLTVGAVGA